MAAARRIEEERRNAERNRAREERRQRRQEEQDRKKAARSSTPKERTRTERPTATRPKQERVVPSDQPAYVSKNALGRDPSLALGRDPRMVGAKSNLALGRDSSLSKGWFNVRTISCTVKLRTVDKVLLDLQTVIFPEII